MEYASKGVAGTGLGLGIAGTALGVLGGSLGNILNGMGGNGTNGWNAWNTMTAYGCSDNTLVNRYELDQEKKIAELQSGIALRDANIYGDQKLLEVYKYFDGELKGVREELCNQRVHNQRTEDSFALARADLNAVKNDLECKIRNEAEKRCCGDNAIVNYVNATFYPKMVADVTTGTETTAQMTFNPIPRCGCCDKG